MTGRYRTPPASSGRKPTSAHASRDFGRGADPDEPDFAPIDRARGGTQTLVIAEKPSVARDLARVLGVAPKGKTHFEGTTHVITWCIGHLVSLAEPAAHDSAWKTWRLDALPMIPPRFRLAARTNAPEQLRAVRDLLQDRRRFRSVVNACDAGREGELIFRYVYELSGSALPIERLWVSSLTDEAITKGFARLEPGSKYDRLADAARCRDEADWLVGLNATRAVTARAQTVGERKVYSLGRVQTPTLALVVTRDEAIKNFVAKDYWQVQGAFVTARGQKFDAQWTHATGARLATESLANALCGRCATAARTETQRPIVESVATKRTREPPPMLFDLTSLQRTANKRFGFSAQRTLDLAQALYERHKALTYPRTDSRHLPRDMHGEMATVLASLSSIADYAPFADAISSPPPMPRRMFDDAQVSDHHAIIPTGRKVDPNALAPDERRLYDLVARRFLAGFFADAEFDDTTVVVRVGAAGASVPALSTIAPPIVKGAKPDASAKEEPKILEALPPPPDRFVARGRVRIEAGWQTVAGIDADEDSSAKGRAPASAEGESADDNERTQMLPKLVQGEPLDARYDAKKKQTRPPPRYSEATLLSAMESAGKSLEDDALRAAMRERGLGTPATRASTIETLIDRGYARRDRRNIVATPLGTALIKSLPVAELASAELTGEWEARLSRIERGEESRASFMNDIGAFVRASIDAVKKAPISLTSDTTATAQPIGRCPRCGNTVVDRTGDYGCALGPGPCGLSIPKKIANRLISPELAAVLLRAKKTVILRGFKSRAGKSFAASLVLGDDGKITFEFESGARTTGETASNEGPPRPAPLRRERATLSAARDAAKEPPRPRAPAPTATSPKRAPTPEATERAALERAANLEVLETLTCPRCKSGRIVQGNRGWGCARWKDGCAFVVWFETAGRKLTVSQLAQLVAKGRTRSGVFRPGNGPPLKGKLVLDLDAKGGSAKFEASAEADP